MTCETGYEGPLCSVCANDYAKSSSYTCEICINQTLDVIQFILFLMAISFLVLLMIG